MKRCQVLLRRYDDVDFSGSREDGKPPQWQGSGETEGLKPAYLTDSALNASTGLLAQCVMPMGFLADRARVEALSSCSHSSSLGNVTFCIMLVVPANLH